MHDDWRTLNRSFTWTNHGEQMTESPVAVEESHRLRAPLPSRRATTRQNQTYKQIKHADRTRRSLIKDMHDWRGQPQIYLSIRLEPQGESGPSPSRRPTERERFSARGQPPRERSVVVSSRSHQEKENRRFVDDPRRERLPFRRRATERGSRAVSSRRSTGKRDSDSPSWSRREDVSRERERTEDETEIHASPLSSHLMTRAN